MKKVFHCLIGLLFLQTTGFSEVILDQYRDNQNKPLVNLPVRAVEQSEDGATLQTLTDANGWFELDLDPSKKWLIEPDPIFLIFKGYFCEPGFVWPRRGIPALTLVPLRPTITPILREQSLQCHHPDRLRSRSLRHRHRRPPQTIN